MADARAIANQITQLEGARKHVLADAVHYSAIIPGILPIIGPKAHLDIRRWGTDFLAEGFASPMLQLHAKETLSVQVLPLLRELLDNPAEDEYVVKSVIQTAASIYGLVFRHITNNPQNAQSWSEMAAIKASILKRFDTATVGVQVCCIKFVQRVVLVQTPGVITDPRRPEQNEISLALVPREHPLIPPPHLEAEASGLLDRLLNVFYEEESNALLVDATLNCLSLLVKTRQTISNKIVSAVLNFNPLKRAHDGMSGREKVLIKSMDKTIHNFLQNILRRNENGPFAVRIRQHMARMAMIRQEVFDEVASRKRGPPEPTDGLDSNKRARLGAQVNDQSGVPSLPPGPISLAQMFTLTREEALKSFDVTLIPLDLVVKITLSVYQQANASQLDGMINAIRGRYLDIQRQPPPPAPDLIPVDLAYEDEEDTYEPEYVPDLEEDEDQVQNRLDPSPAEPAQPETDLALKAFKLAQPPPVTFDQAGGMGKGAISRVFSLMSSLEEPAKAQKAGLNRLAGSNFDREAWLTMITRLATRANPDLPNDKDVSDDDKVMLLRAQERSLGDGIRETLWKYVVEDFRHRIDVAIAWLNEEWYNDQMRRRAAEEARANDSEAPTTAVQENYEKWTLKLLDAIVPYLDANDKVLVRFLGEVPEISQTVLDRVKNLARDPDRVSLAIKAIYYLVAFKPPAKAMAINALEDLWNNYEEARASVKPLLARVRPSALGDQAPTVPKKEGSSTPAPIKESTPTVRRNDSPAPPQAEPSPKPVVAAG